MTLELIYFAVPRNPALEKRLAATGCAEPRSGDTRKAFLLALSEALAGCSVALTVGDAAALSDALSRGLNLPPTAVDWAALGVEGDPDALLPKGALPLLFDGKVNGFVLESGPQAILALDSEAAIPLFDAYLASYLEERAVTEPEELEEPEPPSPAAQPAEFEEPEEPEEPAEPEQQEESAPAEETAEPAASDDEPAPPEAEPEEERMPTDKPAYDVFAGMENAEIGRPVNEKPKKKKAARILVPILCVLLVLALAAGGGYWYLVLRDGGADAYYGALMTDSYPDKGDSAHNEEFTSRYLIRFGALYEINPDVIGTVSIPELKIALPVVSATGKGDYYRWRRFDGSFALYGTPYTLSPYSETDGNPNLVIRGGSLFESLNLLLETEISDVTVKTDSILFGEDSWEILSIMSLSDAELTTFDDSFASLSADQRQANAKNALKNSRVDTGLTESALDNVGLSTNFLTLLTPCRRESGKTLVLFARRAAGADIKTVEPEQQEPTESEETTSEETTSEENESSSETESGDEQE